MQELSNNIAKSQIIYICRIEVQIIEIFSVVNMSTAYFNYREDPLLNYKTDRWGERGGGILHNQPYGDAPPERRTLSAVGILKG